MRCIVPSVLAFILLLATACAAESGTDAPNAPEPSPDEKISCLFKAHNTMTCTALDPSDTTSYTCWDDLRRRDCKDSFDSDYGGGCVFTHRYTATELTTTAVRSKPRTPSSSRSEPERRRHVHYRVLLHVRLSTWIALV